MLSRPRAKIIETIHIYLIGVILAVFLTACGGEKVGAVNSPIVETGKTPIESGRLTEVAPPKRIRELSTPADRHNPQIAILEPADDSVLPTTTAGIKLQVTDFPTFTNPDLGIGPHLTLVLDNDTYRLVEDPSKPVILENLTPGTHTLRVFAVRAWGESYKNDGAYSQVTFHTIAKTGKGPEPNLPLLTYNSPRGVYGAEPILVDYYLANAPIKLNDRENTDWRVRVTINGESFLVDRWQPIYLKGFEKGDNWIKLEFIDNRGEIVDNLYNTSLQIVKYDPSVNDTLAKLVKDELSPLVARGLVEQVTEVLPEPEPEPEPEVKEEVTITPEPEVKEEVTTTPEPEPEPEVKDEIKSIPDTEPSAEEDVKTIVEPESSVTGEVKSRPETEITGTKEIKPRTIETVPSLSE